MGPRIRGVKPHHLRLHQAVARHVPLGVSIVDIGCGTGEMLQRLEQMGARDLTGVDFSQVALAVAAKRTSARLVCADVRGYDFTGYGCAVLTEVLEHIECDALRLPARWVASVPNGPTVAENHVRVYTPETVRERYGADVYQVTPTFIVFGRR